MVMEFFERWCDGDVMSWWCDGDVMWWDGDGDEKVMDISGRWCDGDGIFAPVMVMWWWWIFWAGDGDVMEMEFLGRWWWCDGDGIFEWFEWLKFFQMRWNQFTEEFIFIFLRNLFSIFLVYLVLKSLAVENLVNILDYQVHFTWRWLVSELSEIDKWHFQVLSSVPFAVIFTKRLP